MSLQATDSIDTARWPFPGDKCKPLLFIDDDGWDETGAPPDQGSAN